MKRVSVQELEEALSSHLEAAQQGESFVVTRDGEEIAWIVPAKDRSHWVGPNVGKLDLRPAFSAGLNGLALKMLDEDRQDRLDEIY